MYDKHTFLTFVILFVYSKEMMAFTDEKEEKSKSEGTNFDVTTPFPDSCLKYGTCEYNQGAYIPNCHCDTNCDFYKDCCFDAEHKPPNQTEIDDFEYLTCEFLNNEMYHGMWMISKCPKGQNNIENIGKCENKHVIDVPVTDDKGKLYKNTYCALCHNVINIKHWNVIVNFKFCPRLEIQFIHAINIEKRLEVMVQNGCKIWLIPPASPRYHSRSCLKGNVYTSENSSHPFCKSYMNPVYIGHSDLLKRNAFCFEKDLYTCVLPVEKYEDFYIYVINLYVSDTMPMYVLFSFIPAVNLGDSRSTCITGGEYDEERGICLTSSCSTQQGNKEQCSPEVVHNYVFNYEITLYIDKIVAINTSIRALSMFVVSLPHYINVSINSGRLKQYLKCGINMLNNQTSCCMFSQMLGLIFTKPFEMNIIRHTTNGINKMTYEYKEHRLYELNNDWIRATNKNKICLLNQSITTMGKVKVKMIYMMRSKFGKQNRDIQEIPRNSHVEMEVKDNDIFSTWITIPKWLLEYNERNVSVTTPKPIHDALQTIITYATMSVSSFAIIVTVCFFVYCNFCRSVPDKICINILLTILCFDLLYMVGIGFTDNPFVCFVIGIVLHFVLLSTFTWISVYCGMVVKMLSATSLSTFRTSVKVLYCTGYGIPVLFVLPSVILDILNIPQMQINYSGSVCFPTGFPGNLIFFTLPVVLSIFSNAILFCISLKKLKCHSDTMMNTLAKDTKSYASTYIKLCFLSGFFWAFGIFAQIFNSYELQIAFSLFSGSQGLITSLCFALSNRFRNFLKKEKIRKETLKFILELRSRENH